MSRIILYFCYFIIKLYVKQGNVGENKNKLIFVLKKVLGLYCYLYLNYMRREWFSLPFRTIISNCIHATPCHSLEVWLNTFGSRDINCLPKGDCITGNKHSEENNA